MKENKYDNPVFFEKYSQMNRSQNGLKGAGEWPELEKLLPDFKGKSVLDLGCGYGWHCIYAAEHGASYVLGTDISQKMLEEARKKTESSVVSYQCSAMEDLKLEQKTFDVVISSLAFHYIEDFTLLARNIYDWLRSGGDFVFSVEHPVFTAYGTQDWFYEIGRAHV